MKNITLILFIFCSFTVAAQTELRTGFNLSKEFYQKLTIKSTLQTRFVQDLPKVATYLGEVGVSYELIKGLEAGVYYRYMSRYKADNDYENGYYYRPYHRFFGELEYGTKFGKLKISDRIRYQSQFRDEDGEIVNQHNYLRNKIEVGYAIKNKFKPSLAADVFYNTTTGFDRIRYVASLQYELTKKQAIGISAFKEQSLIGESLKRTVLGVSYKIKL